MKAGAKNLMSGFGVVIPFRSGTQMMVPLITTLGIAGPASLV
jgi:hypothetical protein